MRSDRDCAFSIGLTGPNPPPFSGQLSAGCASVGRTPSSARVPLDPRRGETGENLVEARRTRGRREGQPQTGGSAPLLATACSGGVSIRTFEALAWRSEDGPAGPASWWDRRRRRRSKANKRPTRASAADRGVCPTSRDGMFWRRQYSHFRGVGLAERRWSRWTRVAVRQAKTSSKQGEQEADEGVGRRRGRLPHFRGSAVARGCSNRFSR